MKKYKRKPWTEAERKMLLDNYNRMDIYELEQHLPERSHTAIVNQAWQLRKKGIRFK